MRPGRRVGEVERREPLEVAVGQEGHVGPLREGGGVEGDRLGGPGEQRQQPEGLHAEHGAVLVRDGGVPWGAGGEGGGAGHDDGGGEDVGGGEGAAELVAGEHAEEALHAAQQQLGGVGVVAQRGEDLRGVVEELGELQDRLLSGDFRGIGNISHFYFIFYFVFFFVCQENLTSD